MQRPFQSQPIMSHKYCKGVHDPEITMPGISKKNGTTKGK